MSSDPALVRPELVSVVQLRLAPDRRLVEQVQTGSSRAFEALVGRHRGPLLAFCRRLLGSREDAEDVVQQTFLVAWGELMRAESPRALRPWLYGIARHRCLTLLRARRESSLEEAAEPVVDPLAAAVTTREDLRAILTDVARLPDDQRAALVLAELGDISYEEIARLLGCPREKVKALAYQARSSLAVGRCARETPCVEIREQLATLKGGALRRASLRRHLRDCAGCRAFRDEVRSQRSRFGSLLPIAPIVALKRVILGAVGGSGGGGAGGAAVSLGTLSGAGWAATAIVTVAVPIGGVAVALSAPGDGRMASQTPVPAVGAEAATYGAAPALAAPDDARAEPSASGRAQDPSSAIAPTRDRPRADDRPAWAEGNDTATRPAVPESDRGRAEADHTTSPGQHPSTGPSDAAKPAGPRSLPRPNSHPPPAERAKPGVPRRRGGRPTPRQPAAPTAPSRPSRPSTPAPQERHPDTPSAAVPANPPAPAARPTPSPAASGTPGGAPNADGRANGNVHTSSGPGVGPGGHRP